MPNQLSKFYQTHERSILYAALAVLILVALILFFKPQEKATPGKVEKSVEYKYLDTAANRLKQVVADLTTKAAVQEKELQLLRSQSLYLKNQLAITENNLNEILAIPDNAIKPNIDGFITDYLNRHYAYQRQPGATLPPYPYR